MSILKKGLLLIAIPLVFQLVFVLLLMRVLADADEAEKWTLHSRDVIGYAEQAFGDLVLVQTAARGYLISANPVFADDAARDIVAARRQLADLHAAVSDNPEQQTRVKNLSTAAEVMLAWTTEQMNLVSTGQQNAALKRLKDLDGRERLDTMRAAVDTFLAEEVRLNGERTQLLERARSAQRWSIALGTVGMGLACTFAAFMFSQGISRRLAIVTQNAEQLAKNGALASPVAGKDEIGRLDRVMHQTSTRLQHSAELEKEFKAELERRASELAATNDSLRQQTQENEMFVYSVSHDLRSPLVNLQGFSRELEHACNEISGVLAGDRVPPDVREHVARVMAQDVRDSLHFIKTAVTRSGAIIDALLRLSRAGRVEYRPQVVDVAATVRRVVDAMRGTIHDRQAEVVVGELAPAWGDPTAIEQMLGNLIGNAVNYLDRSRPGRVEVGMTEERSSDNSGGRTYYVKDNGLGIPAAYLSKVFVAFQRLHGDVAVGEGIGLALVRRMVERHGGRTSVESTEGVGSTFFITLPSGPSAATQVDAPADATMGSSG